MQAPTASATTSSDSSTSSALQSPNREDRQEGRMHDGGSAGLMSSPPRSSELHGPNHWSDVDDIVALDVDDNDSPMTEEEIAADPRRLLTTDLRAANAASTATMRDTFLSHYDEPASVSTLFHRWSHDVEEMKSPTQFHDDFLRISVGSATSTSAIVAPLSTPRANHAITHYGYAKSALVTHTTQAGNHTNPELLSEVKLEPRNQPGSMHSTLTNEPWRTIMFEKQRNGLPLPLSKPLLRDDGLLVVGTQLNQTEVVENSIFVVDVQVSHPSHPPKRVHTAAEIRDLQWIGESSVLAAIGSDIHVVQVANYSAASTPSCNLSAPLRRLHSDTIRELAITNHNRHQITFASGGFDETVVVTTLGEGGDLSSAATIGKVDAYDVVSSLRWHPTHPGQVSWTTDGGGFQIADMRTGSKPQLKVVSIKIPSMGGLFCHEFTSPSNVVLGFDNGHLLLHDLRMIRCGEQMGADVPLAAVGDISRFNGSFCAMFGLGGFVSANLAPSGDSLASMIGVGPPHSLQLESKQYKTNGAFSVGSGAKLGVSDNFGAVSIYSVHELSAALSHPTGHHCGNVK